MINIINKTVGYFLNPLGITILLLIAGCWLLVREKNGRRERVERVERKRSSRLTRIVFFFTLVWVWFWSMPVVGTWLAMPLEADYPVILAEDMPKADAIVLMGGGCWGSTNYPYAKPVGGAERIFHSARLWKAGKAPVIIPSCIDAKLADVKVLQDLGIPDSAILIENEAKNTEENAKLVRKLLLGSRGERVEYVENCHKEHKEHKDSSSQPSTLNLQPSTRPKVLLVTSAVHMRRSVYMFEKYAPDIEVIPAATDYCALPWKDCPTDFRGLIPNISAFSNVNSYIHEYIGYWGYKLLRK